nr:MAG TPA_asm: Heme exporter protein D (CcmD) [Caudoviricetes sp.]
MKKVNEMTKEEMIDYLWSCYQVTGRLATLKLIESLATRKGEK